MDDTIYVSFSARLGRREELRNYRDELERHGYEVVSGWIDGDLQDEDLEPYNLAERQQQNLADIDKSTLHVTFTEPPGVEVKGATRGTRHFDAGYAYTICRTVAVGPRENAAHHEPMMERFDTWGAFLEDLTGLVTEVDDDLGLEESLG